MIIRPMIAWKRQKDPCHPDRVMLRRNALTGMDTSDAPSPGQRVKTDMIRQISGPLALTLPPAASAQAALFRFLRIEDRSPVVAGRDIDATGFAPVPLPAAGLLLAGPGRRSRHRRG